MRTWGFAALALGCALLTACSDHVPAPKGVPTPRPSAATIAPDTKVAAQQVFRFVPEAATVLTVTDFARIREQLGDDGQHADALWRRADARAPLLTRGMFRTATRGGGRVDQRDVLWEAHFTAGAEGYVVRFADDADLTHLEVPHGAELRPAEHLLVSGAAIDPAASWASVPGLAELVPEDAEATYVQRGCVPGPVTGDRLEPLDAYSVELGSTVATARLGIGRHDLFERMRLGDGDASFAGGFADGSADPSGGRIGFRLADPVRAAQLTLRHRLPFAVCGP